VSVGRGVGRREMGKIGPHVRRGGLKKYIIRV